MPYSFLCLRVSIFGDCERGSQRKPFIAHAWNEDKRKEKEEEETVIKEKKRKETSRWRRRRGRTKRKKGASQEKESHTNEMDRKEQTGTQRKSAT